MKKCCTCKQDKPLNAFSIRRISKDGLQPQCKACYSLWNKVNAEHKKLERRKWIAENRLRWNELCKKNMQALRDRRAVS